MHKTDFKNAADCYFSTLSFSTLLLICITTIFFLDIFMFSTLFPFCLFPLYLTDDLNLQKTSDGNALKGIYTEESEFPSDQPDEYTSSKSNLKRKRKQNQSSSSSITAHRPSERSDAKRTRVL